MNKKVMWGGIGLLIFSVLTFICWAATTTWTWTGVVKEVSIGHYTDETCGEEVITHTSASAVDGETFTTWVQNKGTVLVTLTIIVDNTANTWITATHNYGGATIVTGNGLSITWTLDIASGHEGESFTLDITITPDEVTP